MNLEEAYDVRTIQLEPRLQEYIRRKKFNEENDIIPTISVEQEFGITDFDIKMINKYKRNKGTIYDNNKLIESPDYVKSSKIGFNTYDFRNDPRYQRVVNKIKDVKDAKRQIGNIHINDDSYASFNGSNPYDELKPTNHFSTDIFKPYNDSSLTLPNSNSNSNSNFTKRYNVYNNHKEPSIAFKQIITPIKANGGLQHKQTVNDIIGNIDKYNKHLDNTYEYIDDDNKKYDKETSYKPVPFNYGNGMPDVSLEDSMRGTVKDTKKKSMGFKNAFENQFSYISPDIYDMEHSVSFRPVVSRGHNKETARFSSNAVKTERMFRNTI